MGFIAFKFVYRISFRVKIYDHHHHQSVPTAQIPLILSCRHFQSAIDHGKSSRWYSLSAQSS